ncbi:flagellin [Neorhizobium alkalisoli]|uniref:flagellin N-terminal helical domain-containing protein n=1 Tax=Neorhizobium alkalisoli TaxID=528178 RepID=UPI003D7C256D
MIPESRGAIISEQRGGFIGIGSASDNAAYWSIATTMRSDNGALSAAEDALGLGAATVDTAYAGMKSVVDVVSEVKSKVIIASENGVDRTKVQEEIEQLKGQLASIASSASFNGVNWLSTDGEPSSSVVASATRDANGNFAVKQISVDLSETALFTTTNDGILETNPVTDNSDRTYGDFENFTTPTDYFDFTKSFMMYEGEEFQYDVQDGPNLYTVTVTKSLFDEYAGDNGIVDSDFEFWNVLAQSSIAAGAGIWGNGNHAYADDYPNPVLFSNFRVTSTSTQQNYAIMDIDVTKEIDMAGLLSRVDGWMQKTIDAAANLGSLSSRISMQDDFISRLSDTINKGVGRLVDADMDKASTRLKALQTQQQLATQSLSIANSSSEGILSLFR